MSSIGHLIGRLTGAFLSRITIGPIGVQSPDNPFQKLGRPADLRPPLMLI